MVGVTGSIPVAPTIFELTPKNMKLDSCHGPSATGPFVIDDGTGAC
jgi:hypothetical protein